VSAPADSVRAQAGWSELSAGRWEEAKAQFSAALAERETAESREGLSWAAWWLDDATTVFDSRERAYRLYRERGDAADAARMAIWLAVDELDFRGATVVAGGWLRRAHRLLDPLDPGPAHGWLAFQEGFLAHGAGETDTARALAATAAEIGRLHAVPDLEMLGLALEGAALVACAEVRDGMARLDEATTIALAGDASIPISSAWTCCFLVSACTAVLDLERAVAWCDRIAEFADRYGSRYMLAFCRAEYGAVDVSRGRWQEAEAMLEAAVDDFSRSRPAWVGGPLVGLAELRRRQGRHDEALVLLDRVGASSGALRVGARIELDRGEPRQAVAMVERLLRRAPTERRLDRTPALEILVHARVALGDLDEAASALAELREIATVVATPLLQASTALAEGLLLAGRDEHEAARSRLGEAVDLFDELGAPFEAARARLELAATLLALGEPDTARREAAAAFERLRDLGALADAERAARLLEPADETDPARDAGITPRELDVLRLLVDGLTNRQIAERLVVSEHTVHRHVTSILRKLDLPSRTAAAAYAVRAGLLGSRS
jgi:LuxR family transcriptional regulator, maltose regulon positive regulatory protein